MDIKVEEFQENVFRICLRPKGSFISFNHFLIKDEQPALIHTGHKSTFQFVYEQVARIIDIKSLRYIPFSHFEPDECGSLNEWLNVSPKAEACINKICDWSVKDFAIRPSLVLRDGDTLNLGRHKLRILETPHFPHAWEACLFYEITTGVLFGSDIGTQQGFRDSTDVADLSEEILALQQKIGYMPFGLSVAEGIKKLRSLEISSLATMHGMALNKKCSQNYLSLLEQENNRVCQTILDSEKITEATF